MSDQYSREAKGKLTEGAAQDVATVAKGGAIQVVGQIAQRSVAFFFGVAFVRVLDVASYGLYRQVSQILANVAQIGLAGFNYAAMRFIARARAQGDHAAVKGTARAALASSAVVSLVMVVLLIVFTEPIARVFGDVERADDEMIRLLRLGAVYVPLFALMQVVRYCTQAYRTMVPSVIAGNIVQPLARFILGIGALVLGFGIAGAVVSLWISVALGALVAAWWFLRMITPDERAAAPKADFGSMWRFALPQGGASLLGIQSLGLGILILGATSSDANAGLFAVALSLQGPANVFLGGIVNIWAPVVADLYGREEIDRLSSLYKTINRWIATFSFPVSAALIIYPEVFVAAYGPQASGAEWAVIILAVGNVFYTGTGPTGYLISMTGHPGVNFRNSLLGVGLYVGLGLWLVPEHGVIGMVCIDAGVTAAINSLRVFQAYRLVGIHPYGRSFRKPVLATLAAAAVVVTWKLILGSSVLAGVGGLALGAAVYLLVLKVMGLDEEEALVLRRIRKRAFKGRGGGRKVRDGE